MADLRSYQEVVQLSENVEYPSGYNLIEIVGTGDERVQRVFPSISVSGPARISSDGRTVAEITVRITDTNSSNPFLLSPNQFESVVPSTPQDLQVSHWITTLHGVFEDQAKTRQVPSSFIRFIENRIHILDGWRASNAPAGWSGFYTQEAWVEYDGQYTCSVEDGLQTVEQWWIRPGDNERQTEQDVTGEIFIDRGATQVCTSGEIPIPNATGQTAVVRYYYRPNPGEAGVAYVNAAWSGLSATWPITVTRGTWGGASLSLSADPQTIAPEERSTVTLVATDSDGGPIVGATAYFYIQAGNGVLLNAQATLGTVRDHEEYQESSSATTFSVSNPAVRITAVQVIGGGFSWNGRVTIRGTEITLVDQNFGINPIVPLRIVYDWGGKCSTIYRAEGDVDGDKVYIGATLGGGVNALCSIDIGTAGASAASISISPNPSDIDRSGTSELTVVCRDAQGNGVVSGIEFTLVPQKGYLGTITPVTEPLTETGSITSPTTVNVDYPVGAVSSVVFLGSPYDVLSFDGNTITIDGDFGVTNGDATVQYTPAGVSRGDYTAIDEDYIVYIKATYADASDTCQIKVGAGDANADNDIFAVAAEPTTITTGQTSTITATVGRGGNPLQGADIGFMKLSGPGRLVIVSATTNAEGQATAELRTDGGTSTGTAQIAAGYGALTRTVAVQIQPSTTGEAAEETMSLDPVYIKGWVDPVTKTFELGNGATVAAWGVAAGVDELGGTDADVPNAGADGEMVILNTRNEALAWDIRSVSVTGGSLHLSPMERQTPSLLDTLRIYVPWDYELNTAREQRVHVVEKTNPSVPIVSATVTLGGVTTTTNQEGIALFSGISPGTYSIYISHPNFKDNRIGVPNGSGSYDDDSTNDEFVVTNYSGRVWVLKRTNINIAITYVVRKSDWYTGWGDSTAPITTPTTYAPDVSYGPPETHVP